MSTPITSTGDVGRISIATNNSASITWYCYERPYANGTSVFVQREVNGVFEAEVRFLAEGTRPEIFFDPIDNEWVFCYVLNEKLWMITIGETDVPITQAAQTGTIIDHFRMATFNNPESQVIRQIASAVTIGIGHIDINDSKAVNAISVGASADPAMWSVRWRAQPSVDSNLNLNIAGFYVYVRRHLDGAVIRANENLVQFHGFDPIVYAVDVDPVMGQYFVVQVNYKGDASDQLVEGRIKSSPSDTISGIVGNTSLMGLKFGEASRTDDLDFTFVDTLPASVLPPQDTFHQNSYGMGDSGSYNVNFTYDFVYAISGTDSTFNQNSYGEGVRLFISGAGLDSIVVG